MYTLIRQKIHNLISDQRFSEILTGSAWALGARVIATALGMVSSIIIARFYGADVLGIVAVLNSFLMLATIFTVLGTNTSILRLIPEHLTKYSPTSAFKVYRKTQYFVAGVSIITGNFLFFGSGFIAESIFSKPQLQYYFALGAIFIVFKSLMDLNNHAIRGIRMIRVFAFMQLLPQLSKLFILVPITIFFYHQDNPIYAMFASIAITALVGVAVMDQVFKHKSDTYHDAIHPMPLKKILSISLPMLMSATMTFIIGQTGVLVLGIFRPESEVGYYSIAVRLATLTSFILNAVNTMAAPKFSELYHKNEISELFYVAKKSAKLIFWVSTPIMIILVLFGKVIISYLYGENFTYAFWAMLILLIGQFVHSISGSCGFFLNMTGNQIIYRNIVFVSALMNILMNILLTPKYGFYGAAISAMVSIVMWNISALIYIKIKYNNTTGYLPFIIKVS